MCRTDRILYDFSFIQMLGNLFEITSDFWMRNKQFRKQNLCLHQTVFIFFIFSIFLDVIFLGRVYCFTQFQSSETKAFILLRFSEKSSNPLIFFQFDLHKFPKIFIITSHKPKSYKKHCSSGQVLRLPNKSITSISRISLMHNVKFIFLYSSIPNLPRKTNEMKNSERAMKRREVCFAFEPCENLFEIFIFSGRNIPKDVRNAFIVTDVTSRYSILGVYI